MPGKVLQATALPPLRLYRRETQLLERFKRDPRIKEITLELLNQRWTRRVPNERMQSGHSRRWASRSKA